MIEEFRGIDGFSRDRFFGVTCFLYGTLFDLQIVELHAHLDFGLHFSLILIRGFLFHPEDVSQRLARKLHPTLKGVARQRTGSETIHALKGHARHHKTIISLEIECTSRQLRFWCTHCMPPVQRLLHLRLSFQVKLLTPATTCLLWVAI